MPILIDGHNLIGQLPDLYLDDPHDEVKLVKRLKAYAARVGKPLIVVFDRGMPGGYSEDLSGGRVEVVFAATGRSADGIMRERIRRSPNPRGLIVVTSDREVIAVARERSARVVRSEEFVDRLRGPHAAEANFKPKAQLSEEEVEEWLELFGVEDEV